MTAQLPTDEAAGPPSVSVARALSVPTRAGIYRRLRTEGQPVSAREAAEMFGLHPNVARSHLDVLAEAGLVVTGRRKQPGGGRPAKVYVAREQAEDGRTGTVPQGGKLAIGLLTRLVRELPDGEERVERLAEEHGRRLVSAAAGKAGRRDVDAAAVVAVESLRAAFPEVRIGHSHTDEVQVDGLEVGLRPVGEADAAVGDAIARGLLRGALRAAGTATSVTSSEGRVRAVAETAGGTAVATPVATVDARGKTYQAGVVATMRRIIEIAPGEHLEVLTDMQGAPAAFARWADRAGHQVVDVARVRDLRGKKAVRLLLRRASHSEVTP
ncbi:MAG TPA: helix-turn-helix domain-containing protein [Nitriliruptorales bacterium]|nr:helix-turn-helix domain-containing protein [Nitriliruptorales bacterium]